MNAIWWSAGFCKINFLLTFSKKNLPGIPYQRRVSNSMDPKSDLAFCRTLSGSKIFASFNQQATKVATSGERVKRGTTLLLPEHSVQKKTTDYILPHRNRTKHLGGTDKQMTQSYRQMDRNILACQIRCL